MICPSFFRNVTYEKIKLHLDHDLELHQGQKVLKQKKIILSELQGQSNFWDLSAKLAVKKDAAFPSHTPFNLKSHPFR